MNSMATYKNNNLHYHDTFKYMFLNHFLIINTLKHA